VFQKKNDRIRLNTGVGSEKERRSGYGFTEERKRNGSVLYKGNQSL
jgi:hypothetical protein